MHNISKLITFAALTLGLGANIASATPFDSCDFNLKLNDGRYEFVWKQTGAHRPDVVLVLPSRFKGFVGNSSKLAVRSVTLYQADTLKKVDTMTMKSNGICPIPPFKECLGRPTFYSNKKLTGKAFKRKYGNLRIKVITNFESHTHCTAAFDPSKRQD